MADKTSREYWIKRAEQKLQKLEKDQNKIERQLKAQYKQIIKELKKELAALKADGTLTDFQQFRMEGTIASIESILDEMARNEEQVLEDGMVEVFKHTAELDAVSLETSFQTVNENFIRETVRTNWSGTVFSDRIWENRRKLGFKIKEVMTQGLIRGDSLQTMARTLADILNKDFNRAMTLMHTETCWIQCEASRQQFMEDGVEEYEYLAFLDERTTKECRYLDGKIFKVEDGKPGVNMPPMHPRCRSAIMPVVESLTELKERKAREEAAKKAEEERIRKAQENKRKKKEAEEQARLAEEARLKAEEERKKKEAEQERIRLAQENKRLKKEAEKLKKQKEEAEEAKKKAEEEAAKPKPKWLLDQEKKKKAAEAKAKKAAEEEAARLKAEEALKKAEEEKKAEEAKRKKEEEARKKAEAKAKEEEKKRKEAEEKARKAEEAKKKAESISPLQALRNKFNTGQKLSATEKRAMIDLTHEEINEKLKTLKTFKKLDEDYVRKGIYKGKVKSEIWSRADINTYEDYVQTSDSFRINQHLYEGEYGTNKKLDDKVDRITELISRTKLKEDTQLVRLSGVNYLETVYDDVGIKNPFGSKDIRDFDLDEAADRLNAALAGKTTKHKSFTSVSYDVNKNVFTNRPILMEIYAEKGVEALYTVNYTESELVLQRDTEFEIIGFEPHMSKDMWGDEQMQLKMILRAKAKK